MPWFATAEVKLEVTLARTTSASLFAEVKELTRATVMASERIEPVAALEALQLDFASLEKGDVGRTVTHELTDNAGDEHFATAAWLASRGRNARS